MLELEAILYSDFRKEYWKMTKDKETAKEIREFKEKENVRSEEAASEGERKEEPRMTTEATSEQTREGQIAALRAKVNEIMAGRLESEIPLSDPYWDAMNNLRLAQNKE